jgi:hypothetical protein
VHVVFLEFVIDPACTLVFKGEYTEAGTMERRPRDPRRYRDAGLRAVAACTSPDLVHDRPRLEGGEVQHRADEERAVPLT